MKLAWARIILPVMLTVVLCISLSFPVLAASITTDKPLKEQIFAPPPLGKVSLPGKSYIELKEANIVSKDDVGTVVFTVQFFNGEVHSIPFNDYWIRLQTSSRVEFPVHLLPGDKEKKRIASQTSEEYTFYATIGKTIVLENLIFSIIKWDFETPKFEKTMGTISIPQNYSTSVPVGAKRVLDGSGTLIKSSIKKVVASEEDKEVETNNGVNEVNEDGKADDGYSLTVFFSLENMGKTTIKLPEYHYFVRTTDGFQFQLESAAVDNSITLSPKSAKDIEFSAMIPPSIKDKQWHFIVTELNQAINLQLPVARYDLPPATEQFAAIFANEGRTLKVSDIAIYTLINKAFMQKDDKNQQGTIYFQLSNQGNKAVKIPNYRFSVRNMEGLSFPVTTVGLENLSLVPRGVKEIKLSFSIPRNVGIDEMKLIVSQPADSAMNKSRLPVAVYEISQFSSSEVSIHSEYMVANNSERFSVKLNSIGRLPWQNKDLLNADITIRNRGTSPLAIPLLEGYYILDGKIKVKAVLVQSDHVISIAKKEEIHLFLSGKIPYTYLFSDIKVVLQERGAGQELSTLVEITGSDVITDIPIVKQGEDSLFNDVGRNTGLKVRRVHTYEGSTKNILYAELQMTNLEKRYADLSAFVGYFKTLNDEIFPAVFSITDQKISPSGKMLVSFWSTVPKRYSSMDGMKVIVGEGITGSTLTRSGEVSDALIKAVSLELPLESKTPKTSLHSIELFPYVISFSKINTTLGLAPGTMEIKFNYNLIKNVVSEYESDIQGHKLLFEFVDDSNVKYSKEVELETGTGTGRLFSTGTHTDLITFTDPELLTKIKTFNSYKLNVYDQFKDKKKLLATQQLKWFQMSD